MRVNFLCVIGAYSIKDFIFHRTTIGINDRPVTFYCVVADKSVASL